MKRKYACGALALLFLLSMQGVPVWAGETSNSSTMIPVPISSSESSDSAQTAATGAAVSFAPNATYGISTGSGQTILDLAKGKGLGQEINKTVSNETGEYTLTYLVVENNKIYMEIKVKPGYEVQQDSANINFHTSVGFHLGSTDENENEDLSDTDNYPPRRSFEGYGSSSVINMEGDMLHINNETVLSEEIPDEIKLVFDDITISKYERIGKTLNEWLASGEVLFQELDIRAEGKTIVLEGSSEQVPSFFMQDGEVGDFISQPQSESAATASSDSSSDENDSYHSYKLYFEYPGDEEEIDFDKIILNANIWENVLEEKIKLAIPIDIDKEKILAPVMIKDLNEEVVSRDGILIVEKISFNLLNTEIATTRQLDPEDFMTADGNAFMGFGWSGGGAGISMEQTQEELAAYLEMLETVPVEHRQLIRMRVSGKEIFMTGGQGEGNSESMKESSVYTFQPVEDMENVQILILQKDGSYLEVSI